MDSRQCVKDVTCTSLLLHQQADFKTKNEDKIYIDAHSIGSTDNSVMTEVLLSGIFHKTRPFLEKVSYQIPASQYDFKYLFKLPHENITQIFKIEDTDKTRNVDDIPQHLAYQVNDEFHIYPNEESGITGLISDDALITKIIDFPKRLSIDPKFNILLANGWDNITYPVKIYYSDDQNNLSRIKPTDNIINFYTNSTHKTLQDESIFFIVFKKSVALAKFKLMDYHGFEDGHDCGYDSDYEILYPSRSSSSDMGKRYKLVIQKQIPTEHLNIMDVTFFTKDIEIDGVKQSTVLPILLSADGRAYFFDETLDNISLQVSSIHNQFFKAHIFDSYCILYNNYEVIMVNMNTFKPSKLNLNISPKHMFHNNDTLIILESNSSIYKLKFKHLIEPVSKIDRFKFKLGLPLRILPLRANNGRSLILSQHGYNGTKSKMGEGLTLSLFNNQSMEIVKTLELLNTSGVTYTLMEPLLKDHSPEACYWEDTVIISYHVPNQSKSYWHIVKISRGRDIKTLIGGSSHSTVTSIFSEPYSIDGCIKICMSTDTGIDYFVLSHDQDKPVIREEGKSPRSADIYNVGGFYQNGIMHVVDPYNGLYVNDDVHDDVNLMQDAQNNIPQIFGDDAIIKVATKVYEPLDTISYKVTSKETLNVRDDISILSPDWCRFGEVVLLSTKYSERKDFQKTFCAMVAADNFIYLYDDISDLIPNNALATRPILKFRPDQRIVNITPISQNYESSLFENKRGMIPLFFLLGLEGAAYVLSVSDGSLYIYENSVSVKETDSVYENNSAPLWIKNNGNSNIRFSFRLVSSE